MATKLDLASKLTNFSVVKNTGTIRVNGLNIWSDTITVPKDCTVLVMFNAPFNHQTVVDGSYFGWGYLKLFKNNELVIRPIFEGQRKISTNIGLMAVLNCSANDVIKIEIEPRSNPETIELKNTVFLVSEI